jgi:ABC-type branched-subunit amino acid transport system substrate-binding protein
MSRRPTVRVEDVLRQPFDRRAFLRFAGAASAGLTMVGGFGSVLTACGGGNGSGSSSATGTTTAGGEFSGVGSTLKVGVIAPTSGIAQFIGDIVGRALPAAKQHIESAGLVKGVSVDYVIVNAPAEEFAQGTAKAYNQLIADPDIIGILWCTPLGLEEAQSQIVRDGIPVIAVYGDPYSEGKLYPEGNGPRNVFQMLLPDTMSFDALCGYAKDDRGYDSVGLMYDSSVLGTARDMFETAARKHDLDIAGIEEFSIFSADYGAQLQRLKQEAPECLIVWGLSDNTAGIVKELDGLGAAYVDTPTAKSGTTWAPQLLGYPGGTGEKKWAELAGDAAKAGSLTAWYLGGLVGGPRFPIRDWLVEYDGHGATGGEEGAPNAWWALLEAVRRTGSRDRNTIVRELERIPSIEFAGLPFSFTSKRHLGMTRDDVTLITLERYTGAVETDPPYLLGREWEETFPLVKEDYIGPVHLVRPTLEANMRAQPDYMQEILQDGWGIQCAKTPADATGTETNMANSCKIH